MLSKVIQRMTFKKRPVFCVSHASTWLVESKDKSSLLFHSCAPLTVFTGNLELGLMSLIDALHLSRHSPAR